MSEWLEMSVKDPRVGGGTLRYIATQLRSVAGCLLGTCLAAVLWGCGSSESTMQARYRFADKALQVGTGGTDVEPAIATIDDETRYTLTGFPASLLYYTNAPPVGFDGAISLVLPLPEDQRAAPRLALQSYLLRDDRWIALPRTVARRLPYRSRVRVELRVPRRALGRPARALRIHSVAPLEDAFHRLETRAVEVPSDSEIRFGVGILKEGWRQGPVRFALHACEGDACTLLFSEVVDPSEAGGVSWRDHRVSLAGFAGRRLSFRFEEYLLTSDPDSVGLPVWSNPTLYAPAPRGEDQPNLLLISLDTLRADHLPSYGYSRDTAPFLDTLARDATLFMSSVTAATTTAPSHMTMFTSLLPSVHAVRSNTSFKPLASGVTTLAQALRAAGFETAAATENAAIDPKRGFQRGFETYMEIKNPDPKSVAAQGQIELTLERAAAWLAQHRRDRFFFFLHTYQVHGPYDPPAEYEGLFQDPVEGFEFPGNVDPVWHPDRYDREIRFTDDQLRDFFGGLAELGLLENTLVVLTSDHGEQFMEHGFLAHGADIHEEILHVPLIFSGPGIPSGARVAAPVSHLDLMPTLLELLGAETPPAAMGRSFASLVRGESADASWWERPIYSEAWNRQAFVARGMISVQQPSFAVRVGQRKLLRYRDGDGFRYVYHDLARDPHELQDLYPNNPKAAADLRELIDRYQEFTAQLAADLSAKEPPAQDVHENLLDPERAEKLRALGSMSKVATA